MPQPGRLSLPAEDMARFSEAAKRLRRASARNLRQGMADGSCRPCDATFVGEVAAGVFFWLPKWLPEAYPLGPMRLADQISDLVALGLEARP
jgi:hypothetical protein